MSSREFKTSKCSLVLRTRENSDALTHLVEYIWYSTQKSKYSLYVTSHEIWVQMRYLVEIEILIFSDTYVSLEYTCEISVRYLKRFLRNRQ